MAHHWFALKTKHHLTSPFIKASLFIGFTLCFVIMGCQSPNQINGQEKKAFVEDLKKRTFDFFWEQVDRPTWQIPDRYPTRRFTSIAATGFGLTSYLVGIENNYITRQEGSRRVLNTLGWLWNSKQGPEEAGNTGYKGFFYHFLTYGEGVRYRNTELSTIDTGLLMAGILACQSYFDQNNPRENKIRNLADSLYLRVNWKWAMNNNQHMSMGWKPESGFIPAKWEGYNEAMILVIMALGSPTHPIADTAWQSWCKGYEWDSFYGYEHVNFSPLFGHQYSHMFIDFRDIQDPYMQEKGIDYFENSRRATLSNRAYCMDNPAGFEGYSKNIWGLTACDGPGDTLQVHGNDTLQFFSYRARGASSRHIIDDGTIAPTAAGGSIPFAPEECLNALYAMKKRYGERLYQEYGFKDAFNASYQTQENQKTWINKDYLGIDQGPILIQLENHQSQLIWEIMKKNPYIARGLRKAGFKEGWLKQASEPSLL